MYSSIWRSRRASPAQTQNRHFTVECCEERLLLAADPIKVNFQQQATVNEAQYPELTGYVADSGLAYGNRGNGLTFGWLSGTLNPDQQSQTRNRDNGNSQDERFDTLNHFIKGDNHSWQIELDNGLYHLLVMAGDPSHTDQVNDLFFVGGDQDVQVNDPDGEDNWDEYIIDQFEVSQGFLRITPNPSGSNQKIAFMEITPLDVADPELAEIENAPATDVTPFSAVVGGNVVFDGHDPPAIRIYYGTTDGEVSLVSWDSSVNLGVQSGEYATTITDLTPNTTYFFRSLAANLAGFSFAPETAQFQTLSIQPASLENTSATDISAFTATIGGEVTSVGNQDPTVTIFWGDNDGGTNVGAWDHSMELGGQDGDFSIDLENLNQNTNYFFRSRATNAGGTTWTSSTSSFSTLEVHAPVIGNHGALDVEAFQALISGQISDSGNQPPDVTLFWGDNDGGTNANRWDHQNELGPINSFFSRTLVNLTQDSEYFFRIRATNLGGTTWSLNSQSFHTLKVTAPVVVNLPAIEIKSSSAELRGTVTDFGNDPPNVKIFYGTTDGGTLENTWQSFIEVGEEFSAFSGKVSNLSPEDQYFFRAQATNFAGTSWAASSETFTTESAPAVLITEFMASNNGSLTTRIRPATNQPFGANITPDWIEIHNPSDQTVDLGGLYLTDDLENPARWPFPAGTEISAGGYLLVMASGEDISNPALDTNGYLHTDFRLSSSGEPLALVEADGTVIHGYVPEYPQQQTDFSYGIDEDGKAHFYSGVSPGAANSNGIVNFVADTSFSVDRGFYDEPFQLQVTTATPGATIVYTTDGSAPTQTHGTKIQAANANADPVANIDITTTTAVRAFAYKNGFESTNVDTHSYFFLNDVLRQATNPNNGRQVIPAGFPSSWRGATGDYQVDPDIVNHANPSDRLVADDLKSVGTISLVMDNSDLFGSNQIYLSGSGSPRAVSVELITGDGGEEFQLDGSVQIQGGSSTNRWKDFKLSMRLKFQSPFGPSKLNHALYEDSPIDKYDNIILDGVLNHSWLHSGQHTMAQYIQDQYVADLHNSMDGYSPYARFMHVYLNGLYWGMYYVHDRPDHAWAAQLFGGDKSEYHAVKHNGSTVINNGNGESARTSYRDMISAANAVQSDPNSLTKWETLKQQLDVDSFITYILANWFTGNHDWPHKNWYATAHVDGPWRYHSWDAEHVTDSNNDVGNSPDGIHGKLDGNDEYLMRMADLIHENFFNDGPLSREGSSALWKDRMDEIDRAIVGESARWGDNRSSRPHTRSDWLRYNGENGGLLANYFPGRSNTVLGQLRSRGLYPNLDAPEFGQHGGSFTPGFQLNLRNPDNRGTIYVTTDGSDPRLIGGPRNPNAFAADSMTLNETTTIHARILDGTTWSALTTATFYANSPKAGDLVVTEINFHPHASLPQFGEQIIDPELYEFVELKNTSNQTIDLAGVQFVQTVQGGEFEGIQFEFASQALASGEHIVVAKDASAFQDRYGQSIRLAKGTASDTFSGQLNNGGEMLTLLASDGTLLQQFQFNDGGGWPGRADGGASTMEAIATDGDFSLARNWRGSSEFGGSPGFAGEGPTDEVVINEVRTHTDLPQIDAVEIHNATGAAIDIHHWYLSDSGADYFRYQVNQPMSIAPGGYLTLDENQLGFGFRGETSDDAWLISADASGRPVRFMDHINFGAAPNGVTLGRWPNGTGKMFPMTTDTLGSENSGPVVGDLVISEVNYHPVDPPAGFTLTDEYLEFVEIWNHTSSAVDISRWRLDNAVDFDFAEGTILGPNTGLVVVPFDPADAASLAEFKLNYQLGNIALDGPYKGKLDNGGDRVDLERPEDIQQVGQGYVLVDRVAYDDVAPWPESADGSGDAIHRTHPNAYGDFANSWIASAATPGAAQFDDVELPGDFNDDGIVDATDIDLLCGGLNSPNPAFDLNKDGTVNQSDVDRLVQGILGTDYGDANLDGIFNSTDLILIFQAGKYENGIANDATWAEGDWNCDREFNTTDLIVAFQTGGYSDAAVATVSAESVAAAVVTDDSFSTQEQDASTETEIKLEFSQPQDMDAMRTIRDLIFVTEDWHPLQVDLDGDDDWKI